MVFLDHTKHPNLDLDRVALKDPGCTLQDYGEMNGTHFWMSVPFDSCQTNHTTEGDTITYQNSIITETRSAAGSILISREFQAEFPFKCTYPRSALVSVTSFSPRERVVYTKTGKSLIECKNPSKHQHHLVLNWSLRRVKVTHSSFCPQNIEGPGFSKCEGRCRLFNWGKGTWMFSHGVRSFSRPPLFRESTFKVLEMYLT